MGLRAQYHNLLDTVVLNEINHYGELKKYQSGAKIEQIAPEQLRLAQEGGIENVVMRFTPIYVKSNAGGLSTIRFRGTSPDHTAINFGGLNINSLTLGHSNLSGIPSFLFDNISLQFGGSSAVNGSGAIGGALFLELGNSWTKGLKATTKFTTGSFGEYFSGIKVFAGNGNWESVTRLYGYQLKNDFPFNNRFTGDVENGGTVQDIQKGASVKNRGFLQELNYRFGEKEFFKSSVWVADNWYQIQPNMQSNYRYNGTDEIENNNVRIWSEYNNNKHEVRFRGGAGFVNDQQVFDGNKNQIIGTRRLVTELEARYDFSPELGIKGGAKYKYIKPEVYAFADSVISKEEHLDVFLSSFFQVNKQLKLTLNLRQMAVSNFKAPFTPSMGGEYVIRTGSYSFLKLTGAVSRSFRIPTFNDRYWGNQGNPDLKPESGKNFEFGAKLSNDNGKYSSTLGVNLFYMNIENWIQWRNFGDWMAQNVLEVVSKGVEFQSNITFPVGNFEGDFRLNYTWNPVEPVKNESSSGIVNRQMMYVPKHMGNASLLVKYKRWRFFTDGQYTGSRYTDAFGYEMEPYFLVNSGIEYLFSIEQHRFKLALSSSNLLNADYQNERYYAMPGRSFRVSLDYDIQIIK